MGENITQAERLLATIVAGKSRVRGLSSGLSFEAANRLETRSTLGTTPVLHESHGQADPTSEPQAVQGPHIPEAPTPVDHVPADPIDEAPLFSEFLPPEDVPTAETALKPEGAALEDWRAPEALAPATPIAPPDVQTEAPPLEDMPTLQDEVDEVHAVSSAEAPPPPEAASGSHYDFSSTSLAPSQTASEEMAEDAEDVVEAPTEPAEDLSSVDIEEPAAADTDLEPADEVSEPVQPVQHSSGLPTAPADLPPILNAAPPARPPRKREPLPPAHPALATAAPPSLAQPRAVTPRIVDPNAPRLAVVFEAAAAQAEPQEVPPAPELTAAAEPTAAHVPSPATIGTETAFSTLNDALAAVKSGRLEEAIQYFGDVLDLEPDHAGARIGRGRARLNLGQFSAAMSDFQRAEDAAPDAAEPLCAMGDLFFARKEYHQAISRYDAALDRNGAHAMAWCRRGIAHHYMGNPSEALEDLQQAAQLDPSIPNIARYVAMVRQGTRRR